MPDTAIAGRTTRRASTILTVLVALGAVVLALVAPAPSARAETLFTDTFDDGDLNGWSTSGGTWSVVTDGTPAARQSGNTGDARALAGSSSWTDYSVEARVKPLSFNGSDRFVAVLARARSATSYYYLSLRSGNTVQLKKLVNGSGTILTRTAFTVRTNTWYTLRIEVVGSTIRGYVDGNLVGTATDSQFSAGRAGLATFNATATFDDVRVDGEDDGGGEPTDPPAGLMGYATLDALGQNGTTGGAGGPTVTVTSGSALLSEIAAAGPRIIQVRGPLSVPDGMHDVSSDKTIVGVGSGSGITGGGLNIGLPLSDDITSPPSNAVHNVIVRNLIFQDANDDSINVQMFSHHIWLDHNEFRPASDGSVDIKRGSDYVTVSWNRFAGTNKTMLLGHDDDNGAQDIGRLRVTYHNNWFDGTSQRNPRVRFGDVVHVLNNYYDAVDDYGVASTEDAGVLVEGNSFENTESPCELGQGSSSEGSLRSLNNLFVNSGACQAGGSVGNVPYPYTPQNSNDVKASVTAGAGVGRISG